MDNLTELFCIVDDFCQKFMPAFERDQIESGLKKRQKPCRLTDSEIMTLLIHFHQMRFRDFKTYYKLYVQKRLKKEFPELVSYNRFVECMPKALLPLYFFIHCQEKTQTGIYFIDATAISVCHIKRAGSHKVFKHFAKKSKSSMGGFFGFKLHLLINDKGELMASKLTPGTTDDRMPVEQMT